MGSLIIVILIHVVMLFSAYSLQSTLPGFMVQFDDLDERLEATALQVSEYKKIAETFDGASFATQASLVTIESLKGKPDLDMETASELILRPWIDDRSEIFSFTNGEAFYNFAVYRDSPDGKLRALFRDCDSRIRRTDRAWDHGSGQVGACFSRNESAYSKDLAAIDSHSLLDTGRQEDRIYYRSIVCAPIPSNGHPMGVFLVTSSEPNQFDDSHLRFTEIIALLLGHAYKHVEKSDASHTN
jgi:GAF domain-containing protein